MTEPVRARVPTLQKMAQLLQVFTPARPRWGLDELATELGWDESTTHRFLRALVDLRMLETQGHGRYSLGMLPVELTAVYMSTEPRRRELLGRIEAISAETRLTTQIAVLHKDRVAVVASQEGGSPLKAAAMLGERMALHATASGKAILAQLPEPEIRALVPPHPQPFASKTLTTRAQVLADVRRAREDGIAVADSELVEGLRAIAIAVPSGYFDARPAALSCAGPREGEDLEQWKRAERTLRLERERISTAYDGIHGPAGATAPSDAINSDAMGVTEPVS